MQHRLHTRIVSRVVVVLTAVALLATGTVVTSTSAEAAPRYKRMSSTESSYARSVLGLLNKQRAEQGLKRLHVSRKLTRGAGAHNRAMARVNEISHQLAGERDFAGRMRAAGWKYRCAAGENVGVNGDMSRNGATALQAMMYGEVAPNDGHRQNILGRRYTHVGIAVLLDTRNDRLWLTLDFGQRRC